MESWCLGGGLPAAEHDARAVGVNRLWRDPGYVAGALLAGIVSDLLGFRGAIGTVAPLTALPVVVAHRLLPRGALPSAPADLAPRRP